ncbi:MAG TPA: type I glyceraldehyde-3-phosphate dehydrogenase, partial [Saprospirales bacterium]|nr:type I glyceraldehyde-3-phosphate dehydrogenase [Saprospirales bacterium]
MNISILGFGRIGRDLLRQTLNDDLINIVSISDIADKDNLLYLLKYDTIYGKLDAEIETTDTGFKVNGKHI